MKNNPLRNHWTGKTGAVAGIGSTLALLGTGPVEQPQQSNPQEPPAIVVEEIPRPEHIWPEALPEPTAVEEEVKVSEVERQDPDGRTFIQRSFEVVDSQQKLDEYRKHVEAWAKSFVMDANATLEDYSKTVIEWMEDPVFRETTKDVQQLHQHVGGAASVIQRIIERSEEDPWMVLTALLGYLAAFVADPKKPQPKQPKQNNELPN